MITLTKCLVRGWVFLKWGSFVNSLQADRRFVSYLVLGLMGLFHFAGSSRLQLWTVFTIGSDKLLYSIFVISKWLHVAGGCQRHLLFSSNVLKVNRSVQDIDVWHLVISPKFLNHINQKIVQASVFPFYPASWKFLESQRVWKTHPFGLLWKRNIASRFSTTCNRRALASGIQKFVVMKCSPSRKSGVHLQRMSALKCVLLSPGRFRVVFIRFIRIKCEMSIFPKVW